MDIRGLDLLEGAHKLDLGHLWDSVEAAWAVRMEATAHVAASLGDGTHAGLRVSVRGDYKLWHVIVTLEDATLTYEVSSGSAFQCEFTKNGRKRLAMRMSKIEKKKVDGEEETPVWRLRTWDVSVPALAIWQRLQAAVSPI